MAKAIPYCQKCREHHYNFENCRQPHTHPGWGHNWGTAKPGVQVIYTHPPRVRLGSLTGPDGTEYTPPEAA